MCLHYSRLPSVEKNSLPDENGDHAVKCGTNCKKQSKWKKVVKIGEIAYDYLFGDLPQIILLATESQKNYTNDYSAIALYNIGGLGYW